MRARRPSLVRRRAARQPRTLSEAPNHHGPSRRRASPTRRIFAITCFFRPRGCRKRGLTTRLARAAIVSRGRTAQVAVEVCAIEPEKPLTWGEGFVGIASVSTELGFREVARRSPAALDAAHAIRRR